jgi:4-hydroxythreonine-4-phosphate dehydrogenase
MKTSPPSPSLILISMGDPAGIGPDIILKTYAIHKALDIPPFLVIGERAVFEKRAAELGLPLSTCHADGESAAERFEEALPILDVGTCGTVIAGKPSQNAATCILAAIETGVKLIAEHKAGALVTAPIAKSVLQKAGFPHPGHTEFLGALTHQFFQCDAQPVMMIWSEILSVVPLTIHIPLRDVPDAMTARLLADSVEIIDKDWRKRFSQNHPPRLVLSGLNPHAGEDGHIGSEEEQILKPAVRELQKRGFDIKGPFSADTLFHPEARKTYDIALCPSHDQALIPAKTLAFDEGVNITLGLPFIRTSPDHGTAFSLAGTGLAKPDSLIAAIKKAHAMRDMEMRQSDHKK